MTEARILLVEDNRAEAEMTKGFLEKYGYQVTWVETGMAALKIAKTEPVDIVLLDLLLPDINGTEVCRWLKGNEDTRGIPIIMLTIKASTEDKITGLQIGADDYLPKPYDEVELNARIYASLRSKTLQDELRSKNRALQEIWLNPSYLGDNPGQKKLMAVVIEPDVGTTYGDVAETVDAVSKAGFEEINFGGGRGRRK